MTLRELFGKSRYGPTGRRAGSGIFKMRNHLVVYEDFSDCLGPFLKSPLGLFEILRGPRVAGPEFRSRKQYVEQGFSRFAVFDGSGPELANMSKFRPGAIRRPSRRLANEELRGVASNTW